MQIFRCYRALDESHEAIIKPQDFEQVQFEMTKHKKLASSTAEVPFSRQKSSVPAAVVSLGQRSVIPQASTDIFRYVRFVAVNPRVIKEY